VSGILKLMNTTNSSETFGPDTRDANDLLKVHHIGPDGKGTSANLYRSSSEASVEADYRAVYGLGPEIEVLVEPFRWVDAIHHKFYGREIRLIG
jgi:hypothetical protein